MSVKNFYSPTSLKRDVFQDQISRAHMYRMIEKGEIPTIKIGHRLLIPGWYVEQLLNPNGQRQAVSED